MTALVIILTTVLMVLAAVMAGVSTVRAAYYWWWWDWRNSMALQTELRRLIDYLLISGLSAVLLRAMS